jgi:hypothetical protein
MDKCTVCRADIILYCNGFPICLACSEDRHEPNRAMLQFKAPPDKKPSPQPGTSISVDALVRLHALDPK